MSFDSRIANYRGGWAIIPFVRKPHYWVEVVLSVGIITKRGRLRAWRSLCGAQSQTNDAVPALDPDDVPRCKRCAVASARASRL